MELFTCYIVYWIFEDIHYYGNVWEIEQRFEGQLLCVEFWPLQWQRGAFRLWKESLNSFQVGANQNYSILMEANYFRDFVNCISNLFVNFSAKIFWCLIFISFSDFPVGIWYQVHPGRYAHNIVFDKLNVLRIKECEDIKGQT